MNRKIRKYLQSRAAVTPWRIAGAERADFHAAVIIPALAESETLPLTLASLTENPAELCRQTLVLVVVNNRADAPLKEKLDNQRTFDWLRTDPFPALNLAWIDASSSGLELPPKDGVGMARKIGFDLALPQLDWAADPLLISLDADTLVDQHYLPSIYCHFHASSCAGGTLPFRHQPAGNPKQEAAIRQYELYLRCYLFGLQHAGSPYAFHTIGSAFACTAAGYISAGGMNRRLGAEDFYYLQQLAKISGVELVKGTVVQPSPRSSTRVPFGTGDAVQLQLASGIESFTYIAASSFKVLQGWLQIITQGWENSTEDLLRQAGDLSSPLKTFLGELEFCTTWERIRKNHSGRQQRLAAFHTWFDGLRTRQLLTRVNCPAGMDKAQLIKELLAWGGVEEQNSAKDALATLERLQGVD